MLQFCKTFKVILMYRTEPLCFYHHTESMLSVSLSKCILLAYGINLFPLETLHLIQLIHYQRENSKLEEKEDRSPCLSSLL